MEIIGIDPGVTTGIAVWPDETHSFKNFKECMQFLDRIVNNESVLVVEQYNTRFPNNNGDITLRLIGAIEWLAMQKECRLIFQAPYVKKAHRDGVILGNNTHERDAYLHAKFWHSTRLVEVLK